MYAKNQREMGSGLGRIHFGLSRTALMQSDTAQLVALIKNRAYLINFGETLTFELQTTDYQRLAS
jgi:hypothetical protein